MSIDKDIKQHKFTNEYQRASINMMYTYGWLVEKIKRFLLPVDITMQQFNILRILRGSHPAPLSTLQIRERMLDKRSDTSRIVDRLMAKGLVRKGVSGKDRRLVDVVITVKGRNLLKKLDLRQPDLDNILQNITEQEAAKLSKILDKIRGGIK